MAPRVTTSYDSFVRVSWPCVSIHVLQITHTNEDALASVHILCRTDPHVAKVPK